MASRTLEDGAQRCPDAADGERCQDAAGGAQKDQSNVKMQPVVHRRIKEGSQSQECLGEATPSRPLHCVTSCGEIAAMANAEDASPPGHQTKSKDQGSRQRRRHAPLVIGIAAMQRVQRETVVNAVVNRMVRLARRSVAIQIQWLHEGNVAEWPPCNVLWILWTPDLPMEKLKAYVKQAKPFELNSLDGLSLLLDRRQMLRRCVESKIPVPHHIMCSRDGGHDPIIEESDEHISINGERLDKPFLEKPADATDFSMFVYFPASARGGCGRVSNEGFDSAGNETGGPSRSRVRRDTSYIYAQFIPSEGFDMQVLVAGSTYVHGEVQHNMQTLEREWVPVFLEAEEKQLAQKVRLAFNLAMFRMSMLRAQMGAASEGSNTYVIEVFPEYGGMPKMPDPGRSVNQALVDDIANAVLGEIRARVDCWKIRAAPRVSNGKDLVRTHTWQGNPANRTWSGPKDSNMHRTWSPKEDDTVTFHVEDEDPLASLAETEEVAETEGEYSEAADPSRCKQPPQLLAVLAVFRHGDRTPKQKVKLKLKVSKLAGDARLFLGMLLGWTMGVNQTAKLMLSSCASEVELRSEGQLQRLYGVLQEVAATGLKEQKEAAEQPPEGQPPAAKSCLLEISSAKDHSLLLAACEVLGKAVSKAGAASNVHAKIEADGDVLKVTMKWGGDLTNLGEEQARTLGANFKQNAYPDEDMVHMHATLRHDLKVHSSNEPRCAQTAAAFAQGLLSIQAALAVVQVSFVRLDNLGRLDNTPFARSPLVEKAKEEALALLDSDRVVDAEFQREVLCEPNRYLRAHADLEVLREQQTTVRTELQRCANAVVQLCSQLGAVIEQAQAEGLGALLEVLPLVLQRWMDIAKDCTGEVPRAPPGKVANMLDNAKYDIRHTCPLLHAAGERFRPVCQAVEEVQAISGRISSYAELVECGSSQDDKFEIARTFLRPMLRKLRWDLRAASGQELGDESHHLVRFRELYKPATALSPEEATVRSRLYFAHNSHLQTFINLLRWAPPHWRFLSEEGEAFLANMVLPLGYMSHLVIKLWGLPAASTVEDHTVRLEFSPGDSGPEDEKPWGQFALSSALGQSASTLIADGVQLSKFDAFLSELLQ